LGSLMLGYAAIRRPAPHGPGTDTADKERA
jgi:hypothetical protein